MSNLTITDVAQIAGVSVSTVSRILNGKPDVAEKTRQRVWQIIDQVGYSPDLQAQRLRSNTTITPTIALHYPIERSVFDPIQNALVMFDFILGASTVVQDAAMHFNLVTTPLAGEGLLELFRSGQVHGMILMQIHDHDKRVIQLKKTNYPFVMIGRCDDNSGLSYVDFDYAQAVVRAFDGLIKQGHQKIGFIDFPQVLLGCGYGPAKYAAIGYEQVLQTIGIEIVRHQAAMDVLSATDSVHQMLDENPLLTALVAVHGDSLSGIIDALHQRNRKIPQDISLIAIGNQKQCETAAPGLTRVDLPAEMLGYNAAKLLLNRITQATGVVQHDIPIPQLIVGNSTHDTNVEHVISI